MKNKIDRFFKDKIEGHTLSASEEAWAKIEANLSKKNNVTAWRMAAAVLIAGALVSVMIWSHQGAEKTQPARVADNSLKNNSGKEKPAPQISTAENKSVKSLAKKSHLTPRAPRTRLKEEANTPVIATESLPIENKVSSTQESVAVVENNKSDENKKQEATSSATIASTKQKPIKLEFTLEDYSTEQPVATVNEEKSSGLKKVWNLAREVKNGDGPVREIKNEIFALNFRKNKNQ